MNEPPNNTADNEAVAARPRTSLGEQLSCIRERIVASGEPLLSWGDIDQEIAERRSDVA
jgi:hypothetical protein